VQKHALGEVGKSFDGQLCQEYAYQKILKLDHPSTVTMDNVRDVFFFSTHCSITFLEHVIFGTCTQEPFNLSVAVSGDKKVICVIIGMHCACFQICVK